MRNKFTEGGSDVQSADDQSGKVRHVWPTAFAFPAHKFCCMGEFQFPGVLFHASAVKIGNVDQTDEVVQCNGGQVNRGEGAARAISQFIDPSK